MGFEQMTWQRGNRSFIFRGQGVVLILEPLTPSTLNITANSNTAFMGCLENIAHTRRQEETGRNRKGKMQVAVEKMIVAN